MNTNATYYLTKLKRKYLFLRLTEILLLSLGAGSVVYGICNFINLKNSLSIVLPLAIAIAVFITRYFWLKLHQLNAARIVNYINQHYTQLEDSADLLLKGPESLSRLQQIQQNRVEKKFNDVYPTVRLPNNIKQSAILFTTGIVISIALTAFTPKTRITDRRDNKTKQIENKTALPVEVRKMEITIKPPPYTGISQSKTSNPQIKIAEGSIVTWNILFSNDIEKALLIFSGGDSVKLFAKEKLFITQRSFQSSNFYQLRWTTLSGEIKTSDYYAIEVIRDKAPEIAITNLPQFTQLSFKDKLTVDLKSTLSDDYGLEQGYIIATVSKGSGESVKFREEKLQFSTPAKIQGKQVQATRSIDLLKLGMEPGDELYFYVEAIDNKTPVANRSRTETFFIALQDTASENLSVEAGLGVDLMPEYFRSQRQIIIDTEKLLRQKKQITKQEFNSTSNELGYDQKVLRLKYGQFLGEEFESGMTYNTQPDAHDDEEDEKDITEKFGHVHDKENEHNHVPEKKTESHEHEHLHNNPQEQENPLEAFLHRHDDPEEATFFVQSIRAKLKAALTVMWDAELYLRLYEPEKSLPYQYKALKLLKEISNDSRIYVHKTGFDPPPLKEDKRLTGDLAEIKSTNFQKQQLAEALYPGLRAALQTTEELLHQPSLKINEKAKKTLLQGGNELSALALEKPGQYLRALSLIKAITEDEVDAKNIKPTLTELRNSLWKAIPQQPTTPHRETRAAHTLDQSFIENLKALKND